MEKIILTAVTFGMNLVMEYFKKRNMRARLSAGMRKFASLEKREEFTLYDDISISESEINETWRLFDGYIKYARKNKISILFDLSGVKKVNDHICFALRTAFMDAFRVNNVDMKIIFPNIAETEDPCFCKFIYDVSVLASITKRTIVHLEKLKEYGK